MHPFSPVTCIFILSSVHVWHTSFSSKTTVLYSFNSLHTFKISTPDFSWALTSSGLPHIQHAQNWGHHLCFSVMLLSASPTLNFSLCLIPSPRSLVLTAISSISKTHLSPLPFHTHCQHLISGLAYSLPRPMQKSITSVIKSFSTLVLKPLPLTYHSHDLYVNMITQPPFLGASHCTQDKMQTSYRTHTPLETWPATNTALTALTVHTDTAEPLAVPLSSMPCSPLMENFICPASPSPALHALYSCSFF